MKTVTSVGIPSRDSCLYFSLAKPGSNLGYMLELQWRYIHRGRFAVTHKLQNVDRRMRWENYRLSYHFDSFSSRNCVPNSGKGSLKLTGHSCWRRVLIKALKISAKLNTSLGLRVTLKLGSIPTSHNFCCFVVLGVCCVIELKKKSLKLGNNGDCRRQMFSWVQCSKLGAYSWRPLLASLNAS